MLNTDQASPSCISPERGKPAPAPRLLYVDNLRVFLTAMVVAHHAAQPYGPTGGRWPVTYPDHSFLLGPFFHVNASFFMGLFFLLSGYFMPSAYERKGAGRFLKERFVRLGIPLLAFALIVFPMFVYIKERPGASIWRYYFETVILNHQFEFAHLWFVAHLLVYGCVYAAWRSIVGGPAIVASRPHRFPGNASILGYVALLATTSTVVRIWFPIDRWVKIPVPVELAHLPQYFTLFVIGILAYRRRWIESLPASTGKLWLCVGLLAAALRFGYTVSGSRLRRARETAMFDWTGLVWNTWEALLCTGMCIGLLYLFREHLSWQSGIGRLLSRNAYAVYIVHLPVVVAFHFALHQAGLGPLTLTALATVLTLAASFAVSEYALRRIPGAQAVL